MQLQAISGTDNEKINNLKESDSRFKPFQKNKAEKFLHRNSKQGKFFGGEHVVMKDKCPAWGSKCLNCGGRNYFAKACRKAKVKQVETLSRYSNSDDSELDFITSIMTSTLWICRTLVLQKRPSR